MEKLKEIIKKNPRLTFALLFIVIAMLSLYFLRLFPNKITKQNPTTSVPPTENTNKQLNASPLVFAKSELPAYSVTVKNQVGLVSELTKMGLWKSKSLNQFFVVLTDKKQKYEVYQNKQKDLLFSTSFTFAQNTAVVTINIPPSVLSQKNNNQVLDLAALYSAFLITNPDTTKPNSTEGQKFISILKDAQTSASGFFQIFQIKTK